MCDFCSREVDVRTQGDCWQPCVLPSSFLETIVRRLLIKYMSCSVVMYLVININEAGFLASFITLRRLQCAPREPGRTALGGDKSELSTLGYMRCAEYDARHGLWWQRHQRRRFAIR